MTAEADQVLVSQECQYRPFPALVSIFQMPSMGAGRARRIPRGKPSVSEDLFHGLRVIVNGQLVHDSCAGLVQANNLDLDTFAAELQDRTIDGANAGQVPDMCPADINADPRHGLPEVEGPHEVVRRRKE